MSLSTSGSHGVNGDLYCNGTVSATTISGSYIVVGGNDITTALVNVGSFEATLSGIINGSTFVPKATQATNATNATNIVGISTATLSYLDATSSIQTQLNNRVTLTGAQTISGLKTFQDKATFNGGIVINGTDEETGSLTLSGNLTVNQGYATNLNGSCTIGSSGLNFDIFTVNLPTSLKGAVTFANFPIFQVSQTLDYQKSGYGGLISISGATTLVTTARLYEFYHIKTTVATTPILTIPDPVGVLVGCELKLFRTATANAVGLQCATNTNGFIIGSNVITPTFVLGSTGGSSMWYKLFLVCLPNPDVAGAYVWYQTAYQ